MRKFTFYILIFVAIIGLFSPTQVNAIHGLKPIVELNKYQNCRHQGNTHDQCKGWPGAPVTDPGIDQVAPSAGLSEYEICIRNFGQNNEDCKKLPGAPINLTPSSPALTDLKYTLLAPLPCKDGDAGCVPDASGNWQLRTFDPTDASGDALSGYLNLMITIFIGISAVLAVIMIVMGGIEYMTTELISSKEAGKQRIRNAILGLLLALGAWTILNTINPDLLDTTLKSLTDVTVEVTQQDFALSPSTYIVPLGKTGKASGTNCDENEVAASNQTANASLSNAQIHTLACIGGIETGCKSIQNYAWGKGSSAYGPFQILLQGNADCFESNICRQAAGVSGPLNCAAGFRDGNPISGSLIVEQCKKAANNFTCSVSAAACLIKKQPNYSDWNANPNLSKCK